MIQMVRLAIHKWPVLALLAGAISAPASLPAEPLTFTYVGIVNETSGGSAFDAFLGEILRFEYTVNSEAADQFPGLVELGLYDAEFVVSVGALTFTSTAPGTTLAVLDSAFTEQIGLNGPTTGPTVGGLSPTVASLTLVRYPTGPTDDLLASDALPLNLLSPSLFGESSAYVIFTDTAGTRGVIRANGLDIAATSVPEPSEWLSMIVVLSACIACRVRHERNRSKAQHPIEL